MSFMLARAVVFVGRSRPIILRFLGPASASIGKKRAGQFRILGTIVPAVPFPPSSRWVVYGSVLRFIEMLVFLPDLLIMVFGNAGVLGSGAVLLVDLSTQFASSPIVCLVGKSVGSSCLVWKWVFWYCVGCRGVGRSNWAVQSLAGFKLVWLCMGLDAFLVVKVALPLGSAESGAVVVLRFDSKVL
ncbi:hypothetical protein ACOSP7_006848 [Xanthoceras sorbifolium]